MDGYFLYNIKKHIYLKHKHLFKGDTLEAFQEMLGARQGCLLSEHSSEDPV